jgi:hypothetical protein
MVRPRFGKGLSGTNEPVQPTVRLIYGERWTKNKVDVLELVTLRNQGLKWREITARLGICRTTANRALKTMRNDDFYY